MVTPDPRHGRWILPLIIAAMVVLTYTFVNSLEPAESPTGTTTAARTAAPAARLGMGRTANHEHQHGRAEQQQTELSHLHLP